MARVHSSYWILYVPLQKQIVGGYNFDTGQATELGFGIYVILL